MANEEKALDWIKKETDRERARQEKKQKKDSELLVIKNQLTDILIKDGVESTHSFVECLLLDRSGDSTFQSPKMTTVNFSGQWEEVGVQVRIWAKGLKSELQQKRDSSPVYVDVTMVGDETHYVYFLSPKITKSAVLTRDKTGKIEGYRDSDLCLGLGQVVEAIQGGQLAKVGK